MNATILPFPTQGDSPDLPSPEEMCYALKSKYSSMDDVDRDFFHIINAACRMGDRAKIETIIECRAIAWSMIRRNGISL